MVVVQGGKGLHLKSGTTEEVELQGDVRIEFRYRARERGCYAGNNVVEMWNNRSKKGASSCSHQRERVLG